jgi:hypothetical protein
VSISSSAAQANTSAGAPCWIWVKSVELDSKLWRTSIPGFCSSKLFASTPNASVSEEAANTASVPPSPPLELPPQPASPTTAKLEIANAAIRIR